MKVVHAVCILGVCAVVLGGADARADGGTSYTWVGSSQGSSGDNHSWTDPQNWNPQGIPGDGDSVTIASPDPGYCFVNVDSAPAVTLESLSISDTPQGCPASVTGDAITVTGSFDMDGGSLDLPLTIDAGASGTISGTSGQVSALADDLDVEGDLTLSGLIGSSGLRIDDPQAVRVHSGGSLISAGDNDVDSLACCVHPAKIVNDGTLTVQGGTLDVDGVEVDQNGTLATSDSGRLLSTEEPVTTDASSHYTGDGSWSLQDGVTARFGGTVTLDKQFHLQLGTLTMQSSATLGGTATLAGSGTFDWDGGIIEANLTVGHDVAMQVVGAHPNNGSRELLGADYTADSSGVPVTQTNHGTVTVAKGADFTTGAQLRFTNASDGTLSLAPGTTLSAGSCCVNPDRITNLGTVAVPTGSTSTPVDLDNISYQDGSGATKIAAKRSLELTGGATDKLAASTVSGGGRLDVAAPTSVSGSISIGAGSELVLETGGTLDGTATVGGAGRTSWTGGSMSGKVTVSSRGGSAISGADSKELANLDNGSKPSTLSVHAPTTIAAGTSAKHDTMLLGTSTLTLAGATRAGAFTDFDGGHLVNTGTLTVAAGSTGSVFRSGTGEFRNDGTIVVASGTLRSADTYTQTVHGRLTLYLVKAGAAPVRVQGTASLAGSLAAHNGYQPGKSAKPAALTAGTLQFHLTCVTTAGTGATGKHAGHWTAHHTATKLTLDWKSGARTHC